MALSKDQWAEIEERLSHSYGRVELLCDGYKITAVIESIAPLKQGIVVYVNGITKGEWIKGEAEEARKFHRQHKRFLYSAARRASAAAALKKRFIKSDPSLRSCYEGIATGAVTHWMPWWTNAKAFCRHIRKTCTSIEVVKIGY